MQKFRGILRVGFEIAFRVVTFWMYIFNYQGRWTGPSPRGKNGWEKHPDHLGAQWGRRKRNLPYVVEGHASACPRTVGVDVGMWASAGMLWNISDV